MKNIWYKDSNDDSSACGHCWPQVLPIISADVLVKSKHIWRGMPFNTEPVLWPDVWVNWYGATLTGWFSVDLAYVKSMQFADIAAIADYTHNLGQVSISLGYVHYMFPGYGGAFPTTGEAYAVAESGFGPVSVALAGYYDLIEVNGLYISSSLSATHTLGYATPTLSVSADYADGKPTNYYFVLDKTGLTDVTVALSLAVTPPGNLGNYLSFSGDLSFSKIIDSELTEQYTDDRNFFFGGSINIFYSPGGE